MQKLTRAEEELMQVIWRLKKGLLKEIMEAIPEPKPAQSTVSTLLRILKKKGFVGHKAYGKTYEYFPLVKKDEYAKAYFGNFLENYFGGSFKRMLSFFAKEEDLDMKTLDEIMGEIKQEEQHES